MFFDVIRKCFIEISVFRSYLIYHRHISKPATERYITCKTN